MAIIWPTSAPSESSSCCCLADSCSLTLKHVDENRCEDDIFDIYLVYYDANGAEQERFIQQINLISSPAGCCGSDDNGNQCPQTTITVPLTIQPSEVNGCCRVRIQLRLAGTNCCNTYTRFSIEGEGGEVYSQYIGQEGIDQEFDIRDLCNPAP